MAQSLLPYLLALSTAYSSILSHHWHFQLFSALVSSWAFAVATYLIVWLGWIYPYHVSELRHIPTVPGFPLWGQFLDIATQECGVPQRQWHQKYGPIVRYFLPFGSERLSIAEESALRHMTRGCPKHYPKPLRVRVWMSRIFGHGLLLAEGDDHLSQRKALMPAFSTQAIKEASPVFWEKALVLADRWNEQVKVGMAEAASIEVLDWLSRATLDIIAKAGFRHDINSLEHPEAPIRVAYQVMFASKLWSQTLYVLQTLLPSPNLIPTHIINRIDCAQGIIVRLASKIVLQKEVEVGQESAAVDIGEKNIGKGRDIISAITTQYGSLEENGREGLSFMEKRDQVMTFLGAGHDTTAIALAWSLHLLAKHRDVQQRLRKEIKIHFPILSSNRDTLDVDALTDTDPGKLPYLSNVCREVLRYIPPVPLMVRESQVDDVLAGYHIPAGTLIDVAANAINHLPMYWGEMASKFDPDRWDNLPTCWTPIAFMTFYHGSRACIGREYLEMEMKALLCVLISSMEDGPKA
ncbi:cytochrome P450 monooxygenase 78A3 [Fusarium bulbicola]|nr:cytochrome P450 monooxygenase 78A3 [Fusarium bulbicola]